MNEQPSAKRTEGSGWRVFSLQDACLNVLCFALDTYLVALCRSRTWGITLPLGERLKSNPPLSWLFWRRDGFEMEASLGHLQNCKVVEVGNNTWSSSHLPPWCSAAADCSSSYVLSISRNRVSIISLGNLFDCSVNLMVTLRGKQTKQKEPTTIRFEILLKQYVYFLSSSLCPRTCRSFSVKLLSSPLSAHEVTPPPVWELAFLIVELDELAVCSFSSLSKFLWVVHWPYLPSLYRLQNLSGFVQSFCWGPGWRCLMMLNELMVFHPFVH